LRTRRTSRAMPDSDAAPDALGMHHPRATGDVRIVSLVPSLTELLFDLGLGDRVVGRTGFCVHPRPAVRSVPKVGGTKDVDIGRVRTLAPSHLIVNIDENRRETVDALRPLVPHVVVTHPLSPDDNPELYRMFGAIFGREGEAADLSGRFEDERQKLAGAALNWPHRKVLYLIWRKPWMTVSRATYISAMLGLAHWATLPATAGERYPKAGEEDWAQSELILLATEPWRFRERDVLRMRESRSTPAALIDGEMISWYGSRAILGLRYLREFRADLERSS
jgi:ABC-type Fe3+-hydroxamate transport system substrate-binding protein